jgi:hypothetical protein
VKLQTSEGAYKFARSRIQRHPPGSHAGILVLRVDDQSAVSVVETLSRLVASTDLADLRECVAVFRNGDLRVRRPTEGRRSLRPRR